MLNNFELIPIFPIGLIKIKFKDHYKYNFPDIEKKVNKPPEWNCSVNTSFPFIDEHDTLVPPIVKKNLVADLKSSIVEDGLGVIIRGKGFTLITWSGVAVPLVEYFFTSFPFIK